jgi:hypothetical protein
MRNISNRSGDFTCSDSGEEVENVSIRGQGSHLGFLMASKLKI